MRDEHGATRLVAGRYALADVLGRGGAGTVWRAHDTLLDRVVAVKEVVIPPTAPNRDDLRHRVLREARAAARVTHRRVVQVYDVVDDGDRVHLVMELVSAPSLDVLVRRDGPLAPAAAARVGLDVLDALEAAAAQGVVHRDVKPANVLLDADGGKLADFGIASLRDDPSITASGTVLGSPAYMAPEQARGERSTLAADLWALGATLYFAVEGVGPFDREAGALPTLTAVVHEPPRPPQQAGALAPLLLALLDKDPARRPRGEDLRRALRAAAEGRHGDGGAAAPSARADPPGGGATRRRLAVAAAVAALAGAALAGVLLTRDDPQDDTPAAAAPDDAATAPADRPTDEVAGALPAEPDPNEAAAPPAEEPAEGQEDPAPQAAAPDGEGAAGEGDGAAEEADAAEGDGGGAPAAEVPADWQPYTDPATGYQIAHPPDWEVVPVPGSETLTDFRDPSSPRYLRVDWAEEPVNPPTAAWEEMSASFAARKQDYEEVALEPITYQGHDAAWWEYEYTEGGTRLHGVDLGIAAPDNGYALNFVTTEDDWEAAQPVFEAFQAAFVIPS